MSPDRVCGDVVLADYAEVEARWTRTALRSVAPELRNTLTQVAEDANSIVVIADADGVVLWRDGARGVRRPSTHWGS
ncbi:transcriptional regulator of acetoin/glycerol metabolism [Rhodococcus opacus]|nr:transcriptional regulator of acetoin/glycerol metabolism [Rhodococcus opacus]